MSLLLNAFSNIVDPRKDINITYDLLDIIFITLAGVLSGAEGWSEIHEFATNKLQWLMQYQPLESGIPSEDTISRVIRAIDPTALNNAFMSWVNSVREVSGQPLIAIDGKTLKLSRDGEKHNALHSITVWCQQNGRIETRRCQTLSANSWITELQEWGSVQTVVLLERTRINKKTGAQETEQQVYISSLTHEAKQIGSLIRQHWGVENKVHWLLDVVYREDDCRIRKGDGAENVAIIRRLCLNLAKLHPRKSSMKSKLKQAGWNDDFRDELLFG